MLALLNTVAIVAFFTANSPEGEFYDDFDIINPYDWQAVDTPSPGATKNHDGVFQTANATTVDGYLRLELDQSGEDDITSVGAEIVSHRDFGYGTYEFRMRSSTTSDTPEGEGANVSGSVAAAFVYAANATTEIDVEFEGNSNHRATHLLSWIGEHRDNQHTEIELDGAAPGEAFYVYKFVWSESSVVFYRDGIQIASHENIVPVTEGKMIFNHWGTHSEWWGGWATADTPRYVYVDWFRFTPAE